MHKPFPDRKFATRHREVADEKIPGFLRLIATPRQLTVEYFPVPFGSNVAAGSPDSVTVTTLVDKAA